MPNTNIIALSPPKLYLFSKPLVPIFRNLAYLICFGGQNMIKCKVFFFVIQLCDG